MTKESFINRIESVKKYISSDNLSDAMKQLTKTALSSGDFKSNDEIEQVKQTYNYMIHYMLEGVEDNSRLNLYSSIKESLHRITDNLYIGEMALSSPSLYYAAMRTMALGNVKIEQLLNDLDSIDKEIYESPDLNSINSIRGKKAIVLKQLFELIWISRYNAEINDALLNWIRANPGKEGYTTFFVAAILLSLFKFYDSKKFALLLDLYSLAISEKISGVVLAAIVMALNKNLGRVVNDSPIVSKLNELQNSTDIGERLTIIIKYLMQTRETERAYSKLRDEIMPEISKLNPDILKKIGGTVSEKDISIYEDNPEWEEIIENNGIADKLKELSELHSQGADLMMLSFSNLKGFHFFNDVNSWFLPFDPHYPGLEGDDNVNVLLDVIDVAGNDMCDSDKYSIAFAIKKLPDQQSKMLLTQLRMQLKQMKEQMPDGYILKQNKGGFESGALSIIKQLHRFFKFFNRKNEFRNIFNDLIKFSSFPGLASTVDSRELITLSAEFYFKRGYCTEALYWFGKAEKFMADDPSYWEKRGFCHQSEKELNKALECYERSALLSNPSAWLLRKLAVISHRIGDKEKSIRYYRQLLEADTENAKSLFSAGNVMLEADNVIEALQCFYHANYIDEGNESIWRAIAWSELLNGNFDKSNQYYKKLLDNNPTASDYLNAGHLRMLQKRTLEAQDYYLQSAKNDLSGFEEDYKTDIPVLKQLGMDEMTLKIMLDNIKLKLG